MNSAAPFADFLYLLQLEEYYPVHYFRRALRFFFRRDIQKRGTLDWTHRIKATFAVSVFIFLLVLAVPVYRADGSRAMLFGVVAALDFLLVPLWVGLASLIVQIPVNVAKFYVRRKAERFVKSGNQKARIVAVVGSFGKTTTKNFIYQLIRYNYKVQMVEGNVNTPIGIARWLLSDLDKTAQLILVEMDAYGRGEIAQSSQILPPDIFVVTSIGDQHISRFGDVKNTAAALLEVVASSKEGGVGVMSESTRDLILSLGLGGLVQGRETAIVPDDGLRYEGAAVSLPAASINRDSLALALGVAEMLKIPKDFVVSSLKDLTPPPRRHELSRKDGYRIIDDSYNISLTTAEYGVRSAKDLASKLGVKLVVITGGIPESGSSANAEYGKFLGGEVQNLVVLNNCFRKDLVGNFGGSGALVADDLDQAWDSIKARFRPEEVLVLVQPELTDLYY